MSNIRQDIVQEVTSRFTKAQILDNARRNEEYPFGFVIDYIKDMYSLPKTEGWDTAMAICEQYGLV